MSKANRACDATEKPLTCLGTTGRGGKHAIKKGGVEREEKQPYDPIRGQQKQSFKQKKNKYLDERQQRKKN